MITFVEEDQMKVGDYDKETGHNSIFSVVSSYYKM